MVSPELLRRYPFFSRLDDAHLKVIAMLTNEEFCEKGTLFCETDQPADRFYFMIEGYAELHHVVVDTFNPKQRKDFFVGEVNAGEPFGISALIEPYRYTLNVIASAPCRVLNLEANGLRKLCADDPKAEAALMRQIAKAAMARLHDTRVQLAAARA